MKLTTTHTFKLWRELLGTLATGLLLVTAAAPALAQEEKILIIYNWSDYVAEDTIANFEKETGIKVR
jgi:putrescine transport system substrate-binding protein